MSLLAPVDTGNYEGACNSSDPPPVDQCSYPHPLRCSAWPPSSAAHRLGTFGSFQHILLANERLLANGSAASVNCTAGVIVRNLARLYGDDPPPLADSQVVASLIMPFHALPCPSATFHGLPRPSTPVHARPWPSLPFPSLPCPSMPFHPFHALPYLSMPFRDRPCPSAPFRDLPRPSMAVYCQLSAHDVPGGRHRGRRPLPARHQDDRRRRRRAARHASRPQLAGALHPLGLGAGVGTVRRRRCRSLPCSLLAIDAVALAPLRACAQPRAIARQ